MRNKKKNNHNFETKKNLWKYESTTVQSAIISKLKKKKTASLEISE